MSGVRGMVLQAPGINCDNETLHALEASGGQAEKVHIKQLDRGQAQFDNFAYLVIPGGFSDGDAIRAGATLGVKLRKRYGEELNRFVELGKPVIGICNGYQVLVESGLLPYGKIDPDLPKESSLIHNASGKFECRWSSLRVGESACRYIKPELVDTVQKLPLAHRQGRRAYSLDVDVPIDQTVLYYVGPDDEATMEYPANPNGSPGGVTATCDPSGVVLGMMPHPERAFYQHQHQNWRRGEGANPFGALLFKGIVERAGQA